MGRRKLGACFQPENSGPEGSVSSQMEGRAPGPSPPDPPSRKQPSPAGSSKRQDHRAVGCGGARASAHSSALRVQKGPPLGHGARSTHGIKEVSELVLLKAGSQQVVGSLQHTLFEPEGGRLMLTGKRGARRCDCQLSPTVPPNTPEEVHVTETKDFPTFPRGPLTDLSCPPPCVRSQEVRVIPISQIRKLR